RRQRTLSAWLPVGAGARRADGELRRLRHARQRGDTMVLTVNGEELDVRATTIPNLLAELSYEGNFYAIALNHGVVPRSAWHERRLDAGDKIEILTPRQGG